MAKRSRFFPPHDVTAGEASYFERRYSTDEAAAIAQGGQLSPLLDALKDRQMQRDVLSTTIAAQEAVDLTRIDRRRIEAKLRACLDDWQARLMGDLPDTREALREFLLGPLELMPEGRTYRFKGEALLGAALLGKAGFPTYVARLAGLETCDSRLRRPCVQNP